MGNDEKDDLQLEILNGHICKVREILNEICLELDELDNENTKIFVSECLDKLIVEYMKQINYNKDQ